MERIEYSYEIVIQVFDYTKKKYRSISSSAQSVSTPSAFMPSISIPNCMLRSERVASPITEKEIKFLDDAGICRYNKSVLTGNWEEERAVKRDNDGRYLHRMAQGNLALQNARQSDYVLIKEVQLSNADKYLKFGMVVQVLQHNVIVQTYWRNENTAIALSVMGDEKVPEKGCVISGSPMMCPLSRNSFYLLCEKGSHQRDGEYLHFGQTFTLSPLVQTTKGSLYVEAPSPIPLSLHVSPRRNPMLFLNDECTRYCRWQAICLDYRNQNEAMGREIAPWSRIIMVNQAANKYLFTESSSWYSTRLGTEYYISLENQYDEYGRVRSENIWKLATKPLYDGVSRWHHCRTSN